MTNYKTVHSVTAIFIFNQSVFCSNSLKCFWTFFSQGPDSLLLVALCCCVQICYGLMLLDGRAKYRKGQKLLRITAFCPLFYSCSSILKSRYMAPCNIYFEVEEGSVFFLMVASHNSKCTLATIYVKSTVFGSVDVNWRTKFYDLSCLNIEEYSRLNPLPQLVHYCWYRRKQYLHKNMVC